MFENTRKGDRSRTITRPKIVSQDEGLAARKELLAREKAGNPTLTDYTFELKTGRF